jgi:hypothetical protein
MPTSRDDYDNALSEPYLNDPEPPRCLAIGWVYPNGIKAAQLKKPFPERNCYRLSIVLLLGAKGTPRQQQ